MVSKSPSAYKDVALMVDSIKLKKLLQNDQSNQTYVGQVDLGKEFRDDFDDLATEAVVFMAVGKRILEVTCSIFSN